jgi:hypothetical protein
MAKRLRQILDDAGARTQTLEGGFLRERIQHCFQTIGCRRVLASLSGECCGYCFVQEDSQ